MTDEQTEPGGSGARPFRIQSLGYVSLYFVDLEEAQAFYGAVFGPPDVADPKAAVLGWRMGSTWLSLFPAAGGTDRASNPKNAEFAVRDTVPEEVDALFGAFIAAGATACMQPQDTDMYEHMRFACVDDPFGVRVDVYCPIAGAAS